MSGEQITHRGCGITEFRQMAKDDLVGERQAPGLLGRRRCTGFSRLRRLGFDIPAHRVWHRAHAALHAIRRAKNQLPERSEYASFDFNTTKIRQNCPMRATQCSVDLVHASLTDWRGWGRQPKGDGPGAEASALRDRWLLPARPQPPGPATAECADFEPRPKVSVQHEELESGGWLAYDGH